MCALLYVIQCVAVAVMAFTAVGAPTEVNKSPVSAAAAGVRDAGSEPRAANHTFSSTTTAPGRLIATSSHRLTAFRSSGTVSTVSGRPGRGPALPVPRATRNPLTSAASPPGFVGHANPLQTAAAAIDSPASVEPVAPSLDHPSASSTSAGGPLPRAVGLSAYRSPMGTAMTRSALVRVGSSPYRVRNTQSAKKTDGTMTARASTSAGSHSSSQSGYSTSAPAQAGGATQLGDAGAI